MRSLIRYPLYILLFASMSTATGYVTFRLMSSGVAVETPDVRGKTLSEARSSAKGLGLSLDVESERHDPLVPSGRVASQEPAPGTMLKGGGKLRVVVSKGPEARAIPSALGYKVEEARALFAQKGIAVSREIIVHSERAGKGTVVAQRPAPEEWTGEAITLIVSAGPHDVIYFCPSFIGMARDDAVQLASELGLNVELEGPGGGAEEVGGQRPLPGEEIKAGDTVRLKIGGS